MRIVPPNGLHQGRTLRAPSGPEDNRYRHLATTLRMAVRATSHSDTNNLGNLEALARSLSSAARDLSHAAGFARQGQDATRHTDQTLRAIRAIAQEASVLPANSKEHEGLERKLQGLRNTVSRLQTTSFEGLSVFSGSALSVQVHSADISASEPVVLEPSASARGTLLEFSSNPRPDLASIEQALAATKTLHQEFESAARKIEGSKTIIAQERVANIAEVREVDEHVTAHELSNRVTAAFRDNAASIANIHSVPSANILLMLLEEPP